MTERGLVEAAIRGNAQAFSTLVESYQRVILASARRVTRNDADAEDLAQETLVDAYRGLASLRDRGKFRPWLFGILHNKCRAYLQARRPEELDFDEVADELPAPVPTEPSDLAELLDQLPFAYREVLVMRYLQELDFPEIAHILGASETAVRRRCSRARVHLRALAVERNEGRMRKMMAGLLTLPISDAFTHRVIKEVVTMAQVTAKGKAAASGTTAALAWWLGWKGVVTVAAVLVVGAGVAVPVAKYRQHMAEMTRQSALPAQRLAADAKSSTIPAAYKTPAFTVKITGTNFTPATKQRADNARLFIQALCQPTPDTDTMFNPAIFDDSPYGTSRLADTQRYPSVKQRFVELGSKIGQVQSVQIARVQQSVTNNGGKVTKTYPEKVEVLCVGKNGTAKWDFLFNEQTNKIEAAYPISN